MASAQSSKATPDRKARNRRDKEARCKSPPATAKAAAFSARIHAGISSRRCRRRARSSRGDVRDSSRPRRSRAWAGLTRKKTRSTSSILRMFDLVREDVALRDQTTRACRELGRFHLLQRARAGSCRTSARRRTERLQEADLAAVQLDLARHRGICAAEDLSSC